MDKKNIDDEIIPQIAGDPNNEYINDLSNHEIDVIYENYYEKELLKKKKNILDMSLNEIIHNTINFIDNFQSDYSSKVYEYEYENITDKKNNIIKYLTAFGLYIRENDNIIYLGIILIILSFIIYLFSISTLA